MTTFFWDFWGPEAERTARHFEHHLLEFLARHDISGAETGVQVEDGHASAFCRPPESAREAVGRALRPRRVLEE